LTHATHRVISYDRLAFLCVTTILSINAEHYLSQIAAVVWSLF